MKVKDLISLLLLLALLGLSAYLGHGPRPHGLFAALLHAIGRNLYAPLIGYLAWKDAAIFHKDPALARIHRGMGAFLLAMAVALIGLELFETWRVAP